MFSMGYTVHIQEYAGAYIHVDGVDCDLERHTINAIAGLTETPILLQRAGGVQSDNEIRIRVTKDDNDQKAVELAIVRALLRTVGLEKEASKHLKLPKASTVALAIIILSILMLFTLSVKAQQVPSGNVPIKVNCVIGCGGPSSQLVHIQVKNNVGTWVDVGFSLGDLSVPISGTVSVSNFPSSYPVTGTFWQVTQPVSGTVDVGNFPSGFNVNNFPATFAAMQSTSPWVISGAVTTSGTATVSGTITADQGAAGLSAWPIKISQSGTENNVTFTNSTIGVTNAGLTNLDVALSTRTKPADQQHTIIDSGSISNTSFAATQGTSPWVVGQSTGTNLHTVVDSGSITATQGTGTNLHTVTDATSVTTATLSAETTKVIGTVRVLGNGGATVDSTVGSGTAPTNQVVTGSIYNATIPAPSDTQALALQSDQSGNLKVSQGIALKTLSGWTSGTALNATQTIFSNSGVGAVLVHLVQGTTISGGAITFEVSYDNSNWVTIPADAVLDPSSTTFAQISLPYTLVQSTNKPFLLMGKGWQGLRIKLSTQITGSATVTPNYALLAYEPAKTTIALSPTAANLNAAVVGTGTAGSPAGNILTVQGVASMTKLLVTPDSVALPANQSVNIAQINATTPLMGLGATGTGSPRVTTAYADTPTVGAILCENVAKYDASTNGATQLVASSGSKKVYVCGYNIFSAGTVNVKLMGATTGTCATTTDLTPAYQFTAQTGIVQPVSNSPGLVTAASSQLCINTSAGVAVQALVWYAQF
jgi:hypothetical protein